MNFLDMLMDEFGITDAEGPWYTDFLHNVQDDYPNIGLKSVPWGDGTDCPKLYAIKDVLIAHFNERYKYREIGSETETRWQYTVDRVFDNIKRRYEFALGLYDDNDISELGKLYFEKLHREIGIGQSSTDTSSYSDSKTGADTTTTTYKDTPIQALDSNNNYASAINDNKIEYASGGFGSNNRSTSKRTDSGEDTTIEKHEIDTTLLKTIDEAIKDFIDLIDAFVDEFEICFINTLGRI